MVDGGLRGGGILESGVASGAQFTRINMVEDSVFNGVFRNSDGTAGLNGVMGLVKQGPAMLTLAGAGNNVIGDDFQIVGGTVRLTAGTTTMTDVFQVGNVSNVSGTLRVDGGAVVLGGGTTLNMAAAVNGLGFVNMTSGSITTNAGNTDVNETTARPLLLIASRTTVSSLTSRPSAQAAA